MKVASNAFEKEWSYLCDGSVISVAATPRCTLVSAVTVGKTGYLLNDEGQLLWRRNLDFEGWSTAISEDGAFVAFGTANKNPADGTVFVYTSNGILFWTHTFRAPVWSLSFSSNGAILAAACWDNQVYLFKRSSAGYDAVAAVRVDGKSGLYGVKVSRNGELCVVCSYNAGVFVLDADGSVIGASRHECGFYNVSLASGAQRVVAGASDGTFLAGELDNLEAARFSRPVSQRPICGISTTQDGDLVACGSFDGRAMLCTATGETLWSIETQGEVWATAISVNGSRVCIGSGDHTVSLIRNPCDTGAIQEILAVERSLSRDSLPQMTEAIQRLTQLYLMYGLVDYGFARLQGFLASGVDGHIWRQEFRQFLETDLEANPTHHHTHLYLGELFVGDKDYLRAVRHFQQAASSPAIRSAALRKAAECFSELRLTTAMRSAFRQARAQHLDNQARHVLYMLARSYEDMGSWQEAKSAYELVVSWDAMYRNAWDKLDSASIIVPGGISTRGPEKKDYTGLTASLLGPDTPRNVDSALQSVIAARSRELMLHEEDRQQVQDSVRDLLSDEVYSRGITRDFSHLGYDLEMFLKYEFGLPEDEIKKFLETVNALPFIRSQHIGRDVATSLDIGSATGRYPLLLTRLGFRAYGLDIEKSAIKYATEKAGDVQWPRFICGDARAIDRYLAPELRFNVVTCMMGTFDHVPAAEQPTVLAGIRSRLAPGGIAIISAWDIECQHLSYLSMYDEHQKELIRKNSPTQQQLQKMMTNVGFMDVAIRPFCMLPQAVIYDLGIEKLSANDIMMASQADLAARALFRQRHGEMYLAIGAQTSG